MRLGPTLARLRCDGRAQAEFGRRRDTGESKVKRFAGRKDLAKAPKWTAEVSPKSQEERPRCLVLGKSGICSGGGT